MIKIDFLNQMIDDGFEEFEADRKRSKNLKTFVKFENSSYEYDEKKILMNEPKFKKKLNVNVYVKNTNNKNQLF
jgi:hypothetical protein